MEGLGKLAKFSENMMESNDVGGIFEGRGMSRASKRAKERQNRSSGELVTAETRISRSLKLQVTDVRKRSDIRKFSSG